MSRLALTFLVFATLIFAGVPAEKPFSEVLLKDGRVLKNVRFVSYGSTTVMAKWDGGRGTLAYADLPQEIATAISSNRPSSAPLATTPSPAGKQVSSAKPASSNNPKPVADSPKVISGTVYIATAGGETRFLAEVPVYAFESASITRFETYASVDLPKPLARAITDGNGRFEIKVPAEIDFYLFAKAKRIVGGRNRTEDYMWVVPASSLDAAGTVSLSNRNLSRFVPRVNVEGVED